MEITIITNDKVSAEEINIGNSFHSVTWQQLQPAICDLIHLRDYEIIDGFIVNENGLKIKLSRKRGRKNK